jgi:tetratricopeptide (TPR) repeat protein
MVSDQFLPSRLPPPTSPSSNQTPGNLHRNTAPNPPQAIAPHNPHPPVIQTLMTSPQPTNPPTSTTAPLTGRDAEVSLLKNRWEQAQDGMGQVVQIIGEPGLGKSRLVAIARQLVEENAPDSSHQPLHDPPIIEWRCSQRFTNTSLYAPTDYFSRHLGLSREQTPGKRFERLASHLDDYGLNRPESVALFASMLLLPLEGRGTPLGLSPVREREATFRVLREWLRAQAQRRPVLFIIEDLHWIDASTLEFLGQFLAEGLQDRILTILTFRPEFKTPWPAMAHQTSLALSRLTRRQVGDLVRRNTGAALPESLVDQVHRKTGGVPLFVEEFTMMLRDPAAPNNPQNTASSANEIPATLQDLIIARVDKMTTDRGIAQLAATLGREFSHELLAAVASTAKVDDSTLQQELAKLVQAQILHQKGLPPGCTYAFKHALLEDALRDALALSQRQQFHQQIAQTLEARFPQTADAMPELMAHHFTEAGLIHEAVAYWLRAGLRARERFANVEAIAHLNKGLQLLHTLPESPSRDARELEFLTPLGTVFIAARGYGAAEVGTLFKRARELCTRVGKPAELFAITWVAWVFNAVRGDLRLCMELASEALTIGECEADPGMLMEALFPTAVTSTFRGDFAAAHTHCTRALNFDDRDRTRFWATITGEDSGVAHRCYLSVALWHLGKSNQALNLSVQAIDLARTLGQPFTLAFALEHRAWLCNQARLPSEARIAAEEEITIATEQGFAYWLASANLFKADAMVLQGQGAEALPLILKGIQDLRATGAGLNLTFHFGFLADAYTQIGRFDDASKALDEGFAWALKTDERFYKAELLRLKGELILAQSLPSASQQAQDIFAQALELARAQQTKAWELRISTSLARLLLAENRHNEARTALAGPFASFEEGFTTPDLVDAKAILDTLGNQRMRQDLAAGLKYVLGCIPPPIQTPVAIDWRYVPSSSLGGDTIGYHWIDCDHLALYLIDVTGHGLDSALLSVSITNILRSGSLPGADMRRPDQVLHTLNDAFPSTQHGDKFFTIWFGVYHQPTRTLTWAGGGHHPSILLSPGIPQPTLLHSSGLMMGLAPDQEYPAESCHVPPNARLLIFSDGIFEILRDGHIVWNLSACIQHLATHPARGSDLMDDLLTHVRNLAGSHDLGDDFSIVQARFPSA